ncbi:MAG: hypothetical protein EOM83_11685 [Clostridia bacterium]|nr:hypothetical protein [Clostridia bacterium]
MQFLYQVAKSRIKIMQPCETTVFLQNEIRTPIERGSAGGRTSDADLQIVADKTISENQREPERGFQSPGN